VENPKLAGAGYLEAIFLDAVTGAHVPDETACYGRRYFQLFPGHAAGDSDQITDCATAAIGREHVWTVIIRPNEAGTLRRVELLHYSRRRLQSVLSRSVAGLPRRTCRPLEPGRS
jgi:hypothetical protein